MSKTLIPILDQPKISKIVKRIAFEIYENNFRETDLFIAGIWDRGYYLAQLIADELKEISDIQITLARLDVDKVNPQAGEVLLDRELDNPGEQVVILVDDVLNTGKTLFYALAPFLKVPLKKLEIAVLVNRSHARFGVSPQYTGYELSTTLAEHIHVSFEEHPRGVFLM